MATEAKYSRYFTYIKPMTENKTVKSTAPYVFTLVTIAVLVIYAIRPTISTITNLQKNIDENQKVLQTLNEKAQNLIDGKRNYENLPSETKMKINSATPDNPSVPSIISSLENSSTSIASVSALQIQPVTLVDDTTTTDKAKLALGNVDFSYNVQGTFSELLQTMQNLSNSPRLIQFNSVIMSKQQDSPIVLSITGKSFYLKQ